MQAEGSETAQGRGDERPVRGRKFFLVLTGVLVAAGVAFGVGAVAQPEPETLPSASQAADLRVEASALIEQIEAYRTERGALPDASLLSPYLEEGYEYEVLNEEEGRYLVRRTAGGVTVTYDGSVPLGLWVVVGGSSSGGSS